MLNKNQTPTQADLLHKEAAEEDNDLKSMGLTIKAIRCENNTIFRETILSILSEKYTVQEFNVNSFRIKNGPRTFDYYPGSQKVFNHQKSKWSVMNMQDFVLFLYKQFNQ